MAGPVGKRPLSRPKCRWENIKMGLKEIGTIYRDSARAREPLFGHVCFRQLRVNIFLTGHSLYCHSEADIQIRLHLRTD